MDVCRRRAPHLQRRGLHQHLQTRQKGPVPALLGEAYARLPCGGRSSLLKPQRQAPDLSHNWSSQARSWRGGKGYADALRSAPSWSCSRVKTWAGGPWINRGLSLSRRPPVRQSRKGQPTYCVTRIPNGKGNLSCRHSHRLHVSNKKRDNTQLSRFGRQPQTVRLTPAVLAAP